MGGAAAASAAGAGGWPRFGRERGTPAATPLTVGAGTDRSGSRHESGIALALDEKARRHSRCPCGSASPIRMKSKAISVALLRELARLFSIQISYQDAGGRRQVASRQALLAAMRVRSSAFREGEDPAQVRDARLRESWSRALPPVAVSWGRARAAIDLKSPLADNGPWRYQLDLENGDHRSGEIDLSHAPEVGRAEIGSERFSARRWRLPHSLPHGYHKLRVLHGEAEAESLLIAAPQSAWGPPAGQKSWGVFAPLYACHTDKSWGGGDVSDLGSYREWVERSGGSVLGTLPLLATFLDSPFTDRSPYSPVSRLFWNELYLDVRRVAEFDPASIERIGDEIDRLRQLPLVDYSKQMAVKRTLLSEMARDFFRHREGDRWSSFDAYRTGTEAETYAAFRATCEKSRTAWQEWEEPQRGGLLVPGRDYDEETARYHLYVQWLMENQIRETADAARSGGTPAADRRPGSGLYLDFPLGVNPRGYDAWRYRDRFAEGVAVGAPPDIVFTHGQNWGFPPLDPDAARHHGHDYFIQCVRQQLRYAGILRIDHVMGLHRLFWIPEGDQATNGVYVRYPDEELYAILALESVRSRSVIVGEDLGTVPEYVPKAMNRHGIRRMFVLQYELKPSGPEPLGEPPAESVASINTHDMPTFAGFWAGDDIEVRRQQGLLDAAEGQEEQRTRASMRRALADFLKEHGLLASDRDDPAAVLQGALKFLARSPAEIVLVALEDLWLESQPQNQPGDPDYPSWSRKMRFGLEEARNQEGVLHALEAMSSIRKQGRIDGDEE
jgi:4-alpha-glucanotransferase